MELRVTPTSVCRRRHKTELTTVDVSQSGLVCVSLWGRFGGPPRTKMAELREVRKDEAEVPGRHSVIARGLRSSFRSTRSQGPQKLHRQLRVSLWWRS